MLTQLLIFSQNIGIFKSSRILLENSESSYLIATSDIYMGLRLVDINQKHNNSTKLSHILLSI